MQRRVVKVQWEIHVRLLDRDYNNESNVLCYFYFLVTKYLAESIYGRRICLAHGINRLLQSKTKGRAWQSGSVYGGWTMQRWLVTSWLTKDTKRASRTEFGYALLILTHIDLPLLGRHPPPKHFWKWYPKRHPKHQLILWIIINEIIQESDPGETYLGRNKGGFPETSLRKLSRLLVRKQTLWTSL